MPTANITAGVSISLSGKFQMQGRDAFNGLCLWQKYVNQKGGIYLTRRRKSIPVRLISYDDRSNLSQTQENVYRLLKQDHVDILFGPYSSGLTRAAAPIAEEEKKILWNHGGSSDAIFQQGFRFLVGVLSPASDYLRELPTLLRRYEAGLNRLAVIKRRKGSFAAQVASGIKETAGKQGLKIFTIHFEPGRLDTAGVIQKTLATHPEVAILVGSFEDDVKITQEMDRLCPPVRLLAAVGAGVNEFHRKLGLLSEGVIGPSQWEPESECSPEEGPDSQWFVAHFKREFNISPNYIAAQSFAAGIVLEKCIECIGNVSDVELRQVAGQLDLQTFYGKFRIDPRTGRQIGHQMLLVQWQKGEKRVVWPLEAAKCRLQ
ncbi:amino acid ABC transporter substrate-binding protein [Acidobacteria bacterium AH-259-L09]|nr:amino acid ABC transporter substrate-binding protein [Acidobacteria bacterium AH-259-L09]